MLGQHVISRWSKSQSNVALSSGEAELIAAVRGMTELIGATELYQELQTENVLKQLRVDANACKGMILRNGVGKVKHLSTKQVWIQGAVESYDVQVKKISRDYSTADVLRHTVNVNIFDKFLRMMNFIR